MTQEIALADFLDQWGDVLKSQVIKNMNPVYTPKSEDGWDQQARKRLANLLRPPFDAQIRRGILPVARTLYKEDRKGAFLVGEMGTGKTIMSLAIAALDPKPAKRILIQCPGHLVRKWIREAEETFPAVSGIKAVAAAAEGLLLVWSKDAADLHRCRWENGRLGYPQPWVQEGKDRRILALDAAGLTACRDVDGGAVHRRVMIFRRVEGGEKLLRLILLTTAMNPAVELRGTEAHAGVLQRAVDVGDPHDQSGRSSPQTTG